jgi:hypothetical protein
MFCPDHIYIPLCLVAGLSERPAIVTGSDCDPVSRGPIRQLTRRDAVGVSGSGSQGQGALVVHCGQWHTS